MLMRKGKYAKLIIGERMEIGIWRDSVLEKKTKKKGKREGISRPEQQDQVNNTEFQRQVTTTQPFDQQFVGYIQYKNIEYDHLSKTKLEDYLHVFAAVV